MKSGAIYLFSTSAIIGMNMSSRILLQVPSQGIMDSILGQFGALALSVVGLFALGWFIKWLLKRNDDLNTKLHSRDREKIEFLERELERERMRKDNG